ncbi:hypothetical protein Tco_0256571 [Tanacetum coccineum]
MEDDFKPAVQHQRRVNPKIHEVIKKEAIKLLDAGLIYLISDSPWASLVHYVPKKGGAENLVADHLSRLENPHQSDLEKKEITKTFPLETLGMVTFSGDSSTPWFVDIANYHAWNFIVKGMSSQQKNKYQSGYGGVVYGQKLLKSSTAAIMDPTGGHHSCELHC